MSELLATLEVYYDTAPRVQAETEECGPFTLFLDHVGRWAYARPRLGGPGHFRTADVETALSRLHEVGLPQALEWVHETTPSLLEAVRADSSLALEEIPLMVLPADARLASATAPPDVTVRVLRPHDLEGLADASAVAAVGFNSPGTATGAQGPAERDAAREVPKDKVVRLLAEGSVLVAVAEQAGTGTVATARAIPVDGVAEIGGVATLPSARRQGLGAAVTLALVEAARSAGVHTVFLTAGSADVARLYAALGFERIGTGYIVERRSGDKTP